MLSLLVTSLGQAKRVVVVLVVVAVVGLNAEVNRLRHDIRILSYTDEWVVMSGWWEGKGSLACCTWCATLPHHHPLVFRGVAALVLLAVPAVLLAVAERER